MNLKAYVAEFIGTFALIFIGVGAIAADQITGGGLGLTGIAFAHGLTIAVMVAATAATSGGHLNPAVTIAMLVTDKMKINKALGYIVAQCLGALIAATLIKLCIPEVILANISMGTPAVNVGAGISAGMALVTEIVLTFFLVFVIFGTAVDKRSPTFGGLFIGLTVVLDIMMGGPISGAAMNPARHFGPALLGGVYQDFWLYWVGPVLGGMLAGFAYEFFIGKKA